MCEGLVWPACNVFEPRHEDSKGFEDMAMLQRSEAQAAILSAVQSPATKNEALELADTSLEDLGPHNNLWAAA